MCETERINDFITKVRNLEGAIINRGKILDLLALVTHKDLWKYAVKALLVALDDHWIDKFYLLQKVQYCKDHLENPHKFLDVFRQKIFDQLLYINAFKE